MRSGHSGDEGPAGGPRTRSRRNLIQESLRLLEIGGVEDAQLMTQLQQGSMEAWRDFQDAALRWSAMWPEACRDPMRYYQRTLEQSMNTTRRTLELTRQTSETVSRSLQEMRRTAEEAGRSVARPPVVA